MTIEREVIEPLLPQYANSRAYANFLRGINTISTNVDYSGGLDTFAKWSNVTDLDLLLSGTIEDMEERVIKFVESQKEKGLAFATIRQRLAAIRHLYDMNRKTLNWKYIIKSSLGKTEGGKRDRAYRHEELSRMIEVGDLRSTAIVTVASSSGMREAALAPLNFEHIKEIITPLGRVYRFLVYAGSSEEYITFCTPEAAKALDTYREYRERYGEEITPASPLFRNDFNKRNPDSTKNVKRLTNVSIRDIIYNLALGSGIRQKVKTVEKIKAVDSEGKEKIEIKRLATAGSVRHEVKITHGMKKFASTNMGRAGVNPIYRSYLLSHKKGHKGLGADQLDMVYDKPEDSDLLKEYVRAIPFLTISTEEKTKLELVEAVKKLAGEQKVLEKVDRLESMFNEMLSGRARSG